MSEALDVAKRFGQLMLHGPGDDPDAWVAKAFELLDPDVSIPVADSLPYGGPHRGHEGFLKMGEGFGKTWDVVESGTFVYYDAGDGTVVLHTDPTFRSIATGRSVAFRMAEIITVRDGRIVELVPYYFDTVPLVAAIDDGA